jgi:hypothetical protein
MTQHEKNPRTCGGMRVLTVRSHMQPWATCMLLSQLVYVQRPYTTAPTHQLGTSTHPVLGMPSVRIRGDDAISIEVTCCHSSGRRRSSSGRWVRGCEQAAHSSMINHR